MPQDGQEQGDSGNEGTPLHEETMDTAQARVFGAWLNHSLGDTLREIRSQAATLAASGNFEEAQYVRNAANEAQQLIRDFRSAPEISFRPGQGGASPDMDVQQYDPQEHQPENPPSGTTRIEGNIYKLLSQAVTPRLNNIMLAMGHAQFINQGEGIEAARAITENVQKMKETTDKLKPGYKGIHITIKENAMVMLPLLASQRPQGQR